MGIFVWRAKLLDEMTATSAGKGRSFQSRSQSSFRGQLAGAVHRNADNLFFPHFFSPALFGAYAIAYRVMMLGVGNIAPALTRIELAQARIRSDETRPGDIVRALILVVAITTPLMAGLAAFGASAVQAVLGQGGWSDLETLLPPLAVAGAAQAPLSFLGGSACIALGQLRLQTTIAYTQTCVFLALIFAAPAIGLRTFTYLYAGASVLVLIAALIALFHRQEMRITAVATPLVGIAFLSGVVYGISRLAGNSLAGGIAVGVMITCAAVVSGLLAVRRWHPGQLQAVKS